VRDTPGMVRLLPELNPPGLEVWLTTHRELFTSRRIRAIYDHLAGALAAYIAALT
jgi:DNA-binding transcriptional LysR family regulator